LPIQSNTYFPDKNNWLSRKPEELGMDSGILEEAISIAKEDAVPDYLVLCQVCYLTRKALAFLIHHDFDDKRSVFFSAKASPLVSGYKPDTAPEIFLFSVMSGMLPDMEGVSFPNTHDFDDKRSVFFSAKASPLVSGYKPDTTPEKKSSSLVLGYKPETTPEN
jgi:hypothetical protein